MAKKIAQSYENIGYRRIGSCEDNKLGNFNKSYVSAVDERIKTAKTEESKALENQKDLRFF